MEGTSTVYAYSPLQIKEPWKPSPFQRAHQSIVRSPSITAFVLIAVTLISFMAGGAFVYSVCSFHRESLEGTHKVGIINASCSDELDRMKQNVSQCHETIEAINFTVSNMGKSRAHCHQLKYDIQREIASLRLKNESLVPHSRRRPPVEAWNMTIN